MLPDVRACPGAEGTQWGHRANVGADSWPFWAANPQLPAPVTFTLLGVGRCPDMHSQGKNLKFRFPVFPALWGPPEKR